MAAADSVDYAPAVTCIAPETIGFRVSGGYCSKNILGRQILVFDKLQTAAKKICAIYLGTYIRYL